MFLNQFLHEHFIPLHFYSEHKMLVSSKKNRAKSQRDLKKKKFPGTKYYDHFTLHFKLIKLSLCKVIQKKHNNNMLLKINKTFKKKISPSNLDLNQLTIPAPIKY